MKNIKEYISNNQKIVRGPVNKIQLNEEFNPIQENTEVGYFIITSNKRSCIVNTILIGENQYRTLYRITEVIYPNNYPDKLKLEHSIGDIFADQKFYNPFKNLEKAKLEYDKFFQYINKYKFYPLSDLELAKQWYKELDKEEKNYIQILSKNNAF